MRRRRRLGRAIRSIADDAGVEPSEARVRRCVAAGGAENTVPARDLEHHDQARQEQRRHEGVRFQEEREEGGAEGGKGEEEEEGVAEKA